MNALPGRRPRRSPLLAPLLLAVLLLAGPPRAAAADAAVLRLGDAVRARIGDDGAVTLLDAGRPAAAVLLAIDAPWPAAAADAPPFLLRTREGDPRGHRGLSARADDDADGRIDEDPADGRDNDGDGAVDEDFAAVGETMVVVDRGAADQARRLEVSHWSLPHLAEALVLRWRAEGPDAPPVVLRLPEGGAWHLGEVGWSDPGHPGVAHRPLLTARVRGLDGAELWVGVTLLDGADKALAGRRVAGPRLELPVDGALTAAVAVTDSPHQLRCRMAAVHAARAGAPAAPGREPTPWIVPPPPMRPRDATARAWLRRDAEGRTCVEIAVPRAWNLLLDPETFRLDGAPLAPARHVAWEREGPLSPQEDSAWSMAPAPAHGAAPPPHLYAALPAAARHGPSRWTFVFDARELPDGEVFLDARSVCGLALQFTLERVPDLAAADAPTKTTRAMLAPQLLENWPNPFRDQLSVRFTVPVTVGEGFVWEEGEEPSLKASDPVPYADPMPRAILTIYSLAGHEVAKLFDDRCAPGAYESRWNGLDHDGRPVAAGTYFCKLQIENWSVTKRVALIR